MSREVVSVLVLVAIIGAVWLGVRSGKRQFRRHTETVAAEARAEGHAAAAAELAAHQTQTVVIGDVSTTDSEAGGDRGVLSGIRPGLRVPVDVSRSLSTERLVEIQESDPDPAKRIAARLMLGGMEKAALDELPHGDDVLGEAVERAKVWDGPVWEVPE